jgi:NAD+ diphosphatase
MIDPLLYTGLALDRAHHTRRDADPARLAAHPQARFYPYWRGRQWVGFDPPAALWLDAAQAAPWADQAPLVYLGQDAGDVPLLAMDISATEAGEEGPDLGRGKWVILRSVGGQLPHQDAGLLAYARGILVWRERTRFCSVCGHGLAVADGGHSTRCLNPSCGALHFPRTDPAIIMLVSDGTDRILLGRQAIWAPGMYSCLAGFVEPGESLEEAVAREVWEESGITIIGARYVASQPWPFPSSLMVGFEAMAEPGAPNPDRHEIEDVRWFTRAELADFGEFDAPGPGGLFLPRRDAIARHLIQRWLA